MSKSLLLSQLLRLLKSNDEKTIGYLSYWVGELLGDFLPGIETGNHCQNPGEYYGGLATLIVEAKMAEQISDNNWRAVRNKDLNFGFCRDLLPPKVEGDTGISFCKAWRNLQIDALCSSQRELIYLLIHDKLPVKERLFRIGQEVDPYCVHCLQQNVAVISNVDHFFCTCPRILNIWSPVCTAVRSLLGCSDSDESILRINISVERCPGIVWLIGAYISEVWNTKENGINTEKFFGFLKFKFKTSKLGTPLQMNRITRDLP